MGYANRIIEYAHKIGKNTADFTVNDLAGFMKVWMKEKEKPLTSQQQTEYNKDLTAMNKYRAAQQSRLPIEVLEQGIESPINDGVEVVIKSDEIICSMELARADVNALLWAIGAVMNDYNVEGEMKVSLAQLKEALEEV